MATPQPPALLLETVETALYGRSGGGDPTDMMDRIDAAFGHLPGSDKRPLSDRMNDVLVGALALPPVVEFTPRDPPPGFPGAVHYAFYPLVGVGAYASRGAALEALRPFIRAATTAAEGGPPTAPGDLPRGPHGWLPPGAVALAARTGGRGPSWPEAAMMAIYLAAHSAQLPPGAPLTLASAYLAARPKSLPRPQTEVFAHPGLLVATEVPIGAVAAAAAKEGGAAATAAAAADASMVVLVRYSLPAPGAAAAAAGEGGKKGDGGKLK
jgi:hypothetical protein